ncbi:hypothetical protein DEO72_LG8g1003 [Vigna unguiculata]|uniref:Uncharacterized protein n=1 Tax=Vigna unguiculata TaxID=3917 RepID=A0A4D6MNC2_VIGUN|nr:hypothetical protein DEO72_LG8g1003 [Vigna unguiculata]
MHCNRKKNERKTGVTSTTAQQHQSQWFPPQSEHLDGRNPPRPEQHQTEHPHSRESPIRIPFTTKMEATIRKKIMGKDELKAWIIARATKPLPCFSRHQSGSPNSNTSHQKRYWKEAVTTAIGSGIATAAVVAMGGNSSSDFNNAFGEEEPSFAVGEGSDTGRRPLR